jgi:hypothetical protein
LAFDAKNQPVADVTTATSWSSLSPDVAIIDSDGTVHGLSPGRATIQGTYRGIIATAQLTVFALSELTLFFSTNSQRVVHVDDSPSVSLYAGATLGLAGIAFDVSNRATWTSTNPQRVRIDAPGHATALGIGFADVIATYHGQNEIEGVLVIPNAVVSRDSVSVPQFGGSISGNIHVGGAMSASNDVSYTLTAAASGRIVYQLVNQDFSSIGNDPSVNISSGQGTIRMSDSLVIPPRTTAVCYSAMLFAGNAPPIAVYYPGCIDLIRFP